MEKKGGSQVTVAQRIQQRMNEQGWSQNRLAKAADISQSGLSSILKGSVSPTQNTLQAIATALKCTVSELIDESRPNVVTIIHNAIPILGNIACSPQNIPDTNPDGYADLPDGVHADFAIRCKGDSMSPTFRDGDLVLIRQQPDVNNGQIAAVGIGGETTLKHVYRRDDGLLLTADNAAYTPIFVPANSDDEIVIYGIAVGYTRIFD